MAEHKVILFRLGWYLTSEKRQAGHGCVYIYWFYCVYFVCLLFFFTQLSFLDWRRNVYNGRTYYFFYLCMDQKLWLLKETVLENIELSAFNCSVTCATNGESRQYCCDLRKNQAYASKTFLRYIYAYSKVICFKGRLTGTYSLNQVAKCAHY